MYLLAYKWSNSSRNVKMFFFSILIKGLTGRFFQESELFFYCNWIIRKMSEMLIKAERHMVNGHEVDLRQKKEERLTCPAYLYLSRKEQEIDRIQTLALQKDLGFDYRHPDDIMIMLCLAQIIKHHSLKRRRLTRS